MIIVSQDKIRIVNFDNIYYIDYYKINGTYKIDANTDKYSISLGYYKTEERAKEVLQEIILTYTGEAMVEYNGYISFEMPKE